MRDFGFRFMLYTPENVALSMNLNVFKGRFIIIIVIIIIYRSNRWFLLVSLSSAVDTVHTALCIPCKTSCTVKTTAG